MQKPANSVFAVYMGADMRLTLKVSILALAVAGSVVMYAQAPQDPSSHPHPGMRHHEPNPEFETRMLTRRLSLTTEQAAAVEPILASQREEMKALKPSDGSRPDFKAMREQHKAIMDETKQKLATVLSAEQMQKFDEMHRPGPHGKRGDWGPKPTPAPGA
jgi:Spy/CpxP family protein refolding chaperone